MDNVQRFGVITARRAKTPAGDHFEGDQPFSGSEDVLFVGVEHTKIAGEAELEADPNWLPVDEGLTPAGRHWASKVGRYRGEQWTLASRKRDFALWVGRI